MKIADRNQSLIQEIFFDGDENDCLALLGLVVENEKLLPSQLPAVAKENHLKKVGIYYFMRVYLLLGNFLI